MGRSMTDRANQRSVSLADATLSCSGGAMRSRPIEAVPVMDHELAGEPEVVKRHGGVLATAVVGDGRTAREIAIAQRAAHFEHPAHLANERPILATELRPAGLVPAAPHVDPPRRQVGHRPDPEVAAVIEEAALLVHERVQIGCSVGIHAAPEREVVSTRDHVERVHLHGSDLADRGIEPARPRPTSARPQPLPAQDEAAGRLVCEPKRRYACILRLASY